MIGKIERQHMKTRVQEEAGKIIEKAHAAQMLYVPPVKYEIKAGLRCTRCAATGEHKLDCQPPFGLIVDPK